MCTRAAAALRLPRSAAARKAARWRRFGRDSCMMLSRATCILFLIPSDKLQLVPGTSGTQNGFSGDSAMNVVHTNIRRPEPVIVSALAGYGVATVHEAQ